MNWNTYDELQLHINETSHAVSPSSLFQKIKGKLDYTVEYAEDRVKLLYDIMDEDLYVSCLSSDKFINQQIKTTDSPLSEYSGSYTHHLDKLADYIMYASFDNLKDRTNAERLKEKKAEIQKIKNLDKRKKELIKNRDAQTGRLSKLVNKRINRSYREDENFSLDNGETSERFFQRHGISPVHYLHIDKELNQKKVFKNSFKYWVHYGQHNQSGLPSIFPQVSYETPYFMLAFESLASMNEGIANTMNQISRATNKSQIKSLEKLKREQTKDYNLAAEILRKPMRPSNGAPSISPDILSLNEEQVDYTNKKIVKAVLYGYGELKLKYERDTTSMISFILKDFEEAFSNIKTGKVQSTVINGILHNSNWSYQELIDSVATEHNQEITKSGVGYHITNYTNQLLKYFLEEELKNEH